MSEIESALLSAGRNAGPSVLADWRSRGQLTNEQLREVITDVWSTCEFPASHLGIRSWVALFRAAGFVSDQGKPQTTEPISVYRGASWGRRRGMSWTTDQERAEWFAARFNSVSNAVVFTATVEPEAVLALVDRPRGENEVVVDPSMLPPIGNFAILHTV